MTHPLLDGARVLDLSGTLAGVYTGRLLTDAGAIVRRPRGLEADLGDAGTGYSEAAYRELGRLLDAGKAPVSDVDAALRDTDIVLDTGHWPGFDARAVHAQRPELIIASLTDYGLSGPLAGRRASTQLRQAQSGSTSARGLPEHAPLAASGETEQFLAGAYAAAAALAVLEGRRRDGTGDLIDLSLLETSNIGQTLFGTTQASMRGRLGEDFPERSVQIPANERTKDGWVGLCTISARQRQDLLLIIGRPDLADDETHAYGNDNPEIDAEIRRGVDAWTREQTTDEVIELASALRIPVSPVTTGETITQNEQLLSRGFFQQDAAGLRTPGPAFRFTPGAGPAPTAGPSGSAAPSGRAPLSGVKVVDLTAWWAGPGATHLLAALGADVVKVESAARPDGMRYSFVADPTADLWWERGPVFYAINTNKRGIALDFTTGRGREILTELLAEADLLIENFTPRVLDSLGLDWAALADRNPGLITVRMPAFGLDGPWRDRTGFAQTIEQSSGLAWITGFPDGPPLAPRGICDPLAGIHAAFAALAALQRQRRTGQGGTVEVSMLEPATYSVIGQSLAWQLDGERVERIGNRHHRAAPYGVYATGGHEEWICIGVSDPEEWSGMARVLGREDWTDPEWADPALRHSRHDEIDAAITEWAGGLDAEAALGALAAHAVPAARVDGAGRLLTNPQLGHRGYFEWIDHAVAGRHPVPGLPFRSDRCRGAWNRTPAPTLGEHTYEVLRDWLRYPDEVIDGLFADGISGTRPTGLEVPADAG